MVCFSLYLGINLQKGNEAAVSLGDTETIYGMIDENAPLPCQWSVTQPESVMSEDKTQAVVVSATNSNDTPCESTLAMRAPNFDLSPSKEEQKLTVPVGGSGSVSWILTPRKTGTFEISVSDILNTKIIGVTVTTLFGFSATQAKVVSIFGSLFGPMLTVPWWFERWWNKRKQKSGEQKEEPPKI